MLNKIKQLLKNEKGAETLEYIAIAAVIIVLGVAAYNTIGVNNIVTCGVTKITSAIGTAGTTG